MKKISNFIYLFSLLYLIFSFKADIVYAGIIGSPHDIVGWFNRDTTYVRVGICAYCHPPHTGRGERLFKDYYMSNTYYGKVAHICWICHGTNLYLGRNEPVVYNEIFKAMDTSTPIGSIMDSHPTRGTGSGDQPKILKNTYIPSKLDWPWTKGWEDGKSTEDIECTTCHNVHDWNSSWDTAGGKRKFLRATIYYESAGVGYNFCVNCHFNRENDTVINYSLDNPNGLQAVSLLPPSSMDAAGVDRGGRAIWNSETTGDILSGPKLYNNNVVICQTCHMAHGAFSATDTSGLRIRHLLADSTKNVLFIKRPVHLSGFNITSVLQNTGEQQDKLLISGSDLNVELLNVCNKGNVETVKTLLERGADVNFKDKDGNTVLIQAVLGGNSEIVKILLEKGANINAKGRYEQTALLNAFEENFKADIVKILLDRGADINVKDQNGFTALFNAVQKGNTETVKVLLEKGADINVTHFYDKETILMYAAGMCYADIVKILLDKGAKINAKASYGYTALLNAVKRGNAETVNILLEKGADINVNSDGKTILMYSAETGNAYIVKTLLEKGADINARDKNGSTALMYAVERGNVEVVKILMEKGADVNVIDDDRKKTIFMYASGMSADIMKTLLEKGVDINVKYKDKFTVLLHAVQRSNADYVKALLGKNADVNSQDKDEFAILLNAIEIGNTDIVKALLEKGEGANAKDEEGVTILMRAVESDKIDIVKFLLEKGADMKAKDKDGFTAFNYADKRRYSDIMKILESKTGE